MSRRATWARHTVWKGVLLTMIRTCAACGAGNRVPARHLADKGRCGKCKAELPPVAEPLDVGSAAEFDEVVGDARVPVIVDFWAAWCGPCRMAAPEVKALASEVSGKAVVLKVDTEALPDVASRYGVRSIPNFVVLREGKVSLQQAGLVPRTVMRGWLH